MPCLTNCFNRFFKMVLLLIVSISANALPKEIDRIMAVVNGKIILQSELNESMQTSKDKQNQSSTLNQMIDKILLEDEIERRNLSASKDDIDQAIQEVMRQNGFNRTSQLLNALKDENVSLEQYRETLKDQIHQSRLLNLVIKPQVKIDDKDIERFHKTMTSNTVQVELFMFFRSKQTTTSGQFLKLTKDASNIEAFKILAKQHTQGPAKSEGGYIGFVSTSDLEPAIKEVVENLNPNQISSMIRTDQGFYKVFYTQKIKGESIMNESDKEKAKDTLSKIETQKAFERFVLNLRAKAKIKML